MGVRRIKPLYQQMPVPPLLDLTPMSNPSHEAHRRPSPPKEPTSPLIIELYFDSKNPTSKDKMLEPKPEPNPKIK